VSAPAWHARLPAESRILSRLYSVVRSCPRGHGFWDDPPLLGRHSAPLGICLLYVAYSVAGPGSGVLRPPGDLAASASSMIDIDILPFLICLEVLLRGLFVDVIKEATLGYMDVVYSVRTRTTSLDSSLMKCAEPFGEASGAILNRNCKTAILGLGSWEGLQARLDNRSDEAIKYGALNASSHPSQHFC
jgi:hypothetical protein